MMLCDACWLRYEEVGVRFCSACGASLQQLSVIGVGASPCDAQQLAGARVVRTLGRSELSEVDLIELADGTLRVRKTLAAGGIEDRALVERFLEEARIHRLLDVPGVPKLHALGHDTERGSLFLILDYVPGMTMSRLPREGQGVAWQQARRIIQQLATVMARVHQRGVLHRDLKPANVMLSRVSDGFEVSVIDFGLGREPRSAGRSEPEAGRTLGTPEYMSPEQALASELDQRSDVYSLGVILYELLTGECPFEGEVRDVMRRHVLSTPQRPSQRLPSSQRRSLPRALEAICMRALSKDPGQRPASMEAFCQALASVRDDARAPRRSWFGLRAAA